MDPSNKVRAVEYIADQQGFHPVLSDVPPEHPTDSESVALAKDKHLQLYAKIAQDHANYPHPDREYLLQYKSNYAVWCRQIRLAPPHIFPRIKLSIVKGD